MKGKDKFDFSILHELMSSMRRSFWSLERSEERFHKALNRAHNNHFAKLMPDARRREGGSSANIGSLADRALRRHRRQAKEGSSDDNSGPKQVLRRITHSVDTTRFPKKDSSL